VSEVLVICLIISALIVWGLPWLDAKARAQEAEEVRAFEEAPETRQELHTKQLDLLYDQIYEVRTCINLGRHDVAKERIEQILFELEDAP
jgi:23S rRNA maturation-related 3'-5' exoribonuclease YhaM